MLRYLVVGGGGHVGFHLCRRLLSRGHFVHVVDDESGHGAAGNLRELEPWALARLARVDAREWANWASAYVPRAKDVDRVVWVADAPERYARIELQLRGVAALLKWSAGAGTQPRVLVVTHPLEHAAADAAVARTGHPDLRRVRLGDVYGPRMAPPSYVQSLLDRLSAGQSVVVDRRESRRIIHVEDAVTALCLAVDRTVMPPIIEVQGIEEWTTYDLARALQRQMRAESEVLVSKGKRNGGEPLPDPWRTLRWRPSKVIAESVGQLLDWHVRGHDALAEEYDS